MPASFDITVTVGDAEDREGVVDDFMQHPLVLALAVEPATITPEPEPEHHPLHGVCWPIASNGDDSLPWVDLDMGYDRFANDAEAATYVAELIGSRVMWAPLDGDPQDGSALSPFVLPPGMKVAVADLTSQEGWEAHCATALQLATTPNPKGA